MYRLLKVRLKPTDESNMISQEVKFETKTDNADEVEIQDKEKREKAQKNLS